MFFLNRYSGNSINKRSDTTKYLIYQTTFSSPNEINYFVLYYLLTTDKIKYLIWQTKFYGLKDLVILSFPCITITIWNDSLIWYVFHVYSNITEIYDFIEGTMGWDMNEKIPNICKIWNKIKRKQERKQNNLKETCRLGIAEKIGKRYEEAKTQSTKTLIYKPKVAIQKIYRINLNSTLFLEQSNMRQSTVNNCTLRVKTSQSEMMLWSIWNFKRIFSLWSILIHFQILFHLPKNAIKLVDMH